MNNGAIEQIGSPSDLYFSPRTVFAADFIGQGNFFDAKVLSSAAGNVEVDAEGLRVRCGKAPADSRAGDAANSR
ncbi:Spermidine/putrescine import ATP-binding protein PotA [compost metagenome]